MNKPFASTLVRGGFPANSVSIIRRMLDHTSAETPSQNHLESVIDDGPPFPRGRGGRNEDTTRKAMPPTRNTVWHMLERSNWALGSYVALVEGSGGWLADPRQAKHYAG
jgi:hypothetical protein